MIVQHLVSVYFAALSVPGEKKKVRGVNVTKEWRPSFNRHVN